MKIEKPEVLQRAWGTESIVAWTKTHACKVLHRLPNREAASRGFQMHIKEESHYLISGQMLLEQLDADGGIITCHVSTGAGWTVLPGTFHRETAITECTIVEVSDPTRDDRYRSGADYGGLKSMTDDDAVEKLARLSAQLRSRAEQCDLLAHRVKSDGLASFLPKTSVS